MKLIAYIAVVCSAGMPLLGNTDTPEFEIGKFSENPRKEIPLLQPMAEYLAERMTAFGYESGAGEVFVDFGQAREAFRNGSLDLLTCGIYEAAELIRSGDAVPLVIKWKREMPEYSSLIIVKMDSDIHSLEDLVGKTIGFEDPGSTSAFFIPYHKMIELDLPLMENTGGTPSDSAINFRFTGSEQNSSALLFQGRLNAIALSDYDWLHSNNIPEGQRGSFRIIWISEPYPRAVEIVRADMPAEQMSYLQDQLIRAHLDPSALSIMDNYHEAARFTELKQDDLDKINGLIEFLDNRERAE